MVRHHKLVLAAFLTGIGAAVLILIAGATHAQVITWDTPVQISDTIGSSGGPRLVVDRQNTVHLLWSDWIDLISHPPYLQYSSKGSSGEWSNPEFIRELGWPLRGYFGGSIGIVTGPDGALHMVWENYRYDDGDDTITYIRRDDGGTWSAVEEVPHQKVWSSAEQPDIGLGPDGTVHVVYKDWLGPGTQKTIQHVMRVPTGGWIATQQITPIEGDYSLPMLAVDDIGNAHLIYTKNYTDHYEFYYAHTNTEGVWSAPMNMGVSPTPWNSVEQLTSGAGGNIHLVWAEWDQSVIPWQCSVMYSGKVRSGGWSNPRTLAHHCATNVAVAADRFGRAHIAWHYDDKLWFTYQNPEGAFTSLRIAEDSDPYHQYPEGLSIAVDSEGGRHVAWGSNHDGNIWSTSISGSISVDSVITESGGSIYAFSGDTYVEFPAGAVKEDVTITHTPQKGTASGDMVGVTFFDLSAEKTNDGTPVTNFDQPYTITMFYTDADIVGIQESTLGLYWLNSGEWEKINFSDLDQTENQVSASLDHMTEFALIGESSIKDYFINLPFVIMGQ